MEKRRTGGASKHEGELTVQGRRLVSVNVQFVLPHVYAHPAWFSFLSLSSTTRGARSERRRKKITQWIARHVYEFSKRKLVSAG